MRPANALTFQAANADGGGRGASVRNTVSQITDATLMGRVQVSTEHRVANYLQTSMLIN